MNRIIELCIEKFANENKTNSFKCYSIFKRQNPRFKFLSEWLI
jgi:hypothetical protein